MQVPMRIKFNVILFVFLFGFDSAYAQDRFVSRQGQVTFFSYASVENIAAKNNQALSIIDFYKKEIAVSMLMRAFVFKKDLMHEHFNESYIETDIYPKATFQGSLEQFDLQQDFPQTKIIEGSITIRDVTKKVLVKTSLNRIENGFVLTGEFELTVRDFNIKIPPILANNIAKIVAVKINVQYQPYDEN